MILKISKLIVLFFLVGVIDARINGVALANFGISPSGVHLVVTPNTQTEGSIEILRSGSDLDKDIVVNVKKEKDFVDIKGQDTILLPAGATNVSYKFLVNSKRFEVGANYQDTIYFSPVIGNYMDQSGNRVNLAIGAKIKIATVAKKDVIVDYSIEKEKNKNIEFKILSTTSLCLVGREVIFEAAIKNKSAESVNNIPYGFDITCNNAKINNAKNIYSGLIESGQEKKISQRYIFQNSGLCSVRFFNEYSEQRFDVKIDTKFSHFVKNIWQKLKG